MPGMLVHLGEVVTVSETNVIHNADCLSYLPKIASHSIDAIITDPPFSFVSSMTKYGQPSIDAMFFEHWLRAVFAELYRISKQDSVWFLWGDWRAIAAYDRALTDAAPSRSAARWVSQVLVHDRRSTGLGFPFRSSFETIAMIRSCKSKIKHRFNKGISNIIRSRWPHGANNHHPAEKSLIVARKLVCWSTRKGDQILDPFAGAGSILLAANLEGRNFLGCEIDSAFCTTAQERLRGENDAIK